MVTNLPLAVKIDHSIKAPLHRNYGGQGTEVSGVLSPYLANYCMDQRCGL
jgi:lysozyme family protein